MRSHPVTRWAHRTRFAVVAAVTAVLALAVATPANAQYVRIEGDGSTWSQGIFREWIKDVEALGMQVVYSGGGSSLGRQNFSNFQDDFAISEIPFQGVDPSTGKPDTAGNRPYAYLPIVAGGTAFTYHVEVGGQLMRDVRLSGETIAKIFTNQITNWNDPQIAADNNGRSFPDLTIVPFVRSDGSGTTAQFTTWLDKQYPDIWRPYYGRTGFTSYYPVQSGTRMLAAPGSDQVMNSISASSGNGTIGYIEYSYALNKNYPVVKVRNAAGYYVEPTDYNVAVALTQARINDDPESPDYLTQVLDDVYRYDDPRAYPLSSYSYMILPTGPSGQGAGQDKRMTTAKRQTLVDMMFYALCEGQSKAGPYGYSPMPLNLVQAGFEQLAKLKAADPAVEIQDRDATKCNNPTFVPGNLAANHLAEIAPMPADCDQEGRGPCLRSGPGGGGGNGGGGDSGAGGGGAGGDGGGSGGVGGAGGGGSGSGGSGGSGGGAGGGGAGGDAAGGSGDGGADGGGLAVVIDPETGEVIGGGNGDGGSSGPAVAGAVSTTVAARPAAGGPVFGALAAAELAALVLVPGVLAVWLRRRGARP